MTFRTDANDDDLIRTPLRNVMAEPADSAFTPHPDRQPDCPPLPDIVAWAAASVPADKLHHVDRCHYCSKILVAATRQTRPATPALPPAPTRNGHEEPSALTVPSLTLDSAASGRSDQSPPPPALLQDVPSTTASNGYVAPATDRTDPSLAVAAYPEGRKLRAGRSRCARTGLLALAAACLLVVALTGRALVPSDDSTPLEATGPVSSIPAASRVAGPATIDGVVDPGRGPSHEPGSQFDPPRPLRPSTGPRPAPTTPGATATTGAMAATTGTTVGQQPPTTPAPPRPRSSRAFRLS